MIRTLKRLFADHPREVKESYFQHMAHSAAFGFKLARLSATAFLHAMVPGIHKTTVSDEIKCMARDMGGRAEEARECRMREAGVWDPGL
ncbi:DUF6356 family protein [Brevundimonas lenta]|uniref:Capsule biosynthesis protein n=1 Tax=Brevundimonas lenta TaxID=424796 RepID=A0A7W6NQB8_9CAUL|nr:DUF6356 family protein [Brevundimonas lenta]MBB4084360.1 hypothetical protein [Brevundimonas lenta]